MRILPLNYTNASLKRKPALKNLLKPLKGLNGAAKVGRLVPLSQAHTDVVDKLRTSNVGQLWPPFFLKNIWLILRLNQWDGSRLDEATREQLLDQLFEELVEGRVNQLLAGEHADPVPTHLLKTL